MLFGAPENVHAGHVGVLNSSTGTLDGAVQDKAPARAPERDISSPGERPFPWQMDGAAGRSCKLWMV